MLVSSAVVFGVETPNVTGVYQQGGSWTVDCANCNKDTSVHVSNNGGSTFSDIKTGIDCTPPSDGSPCHISGLSGISKGNYVRACVGGTGGICSSAVKVTAGSASIDSSGKVKYNPPAGPASLPYPVTAPANTDTGNQSTGGGGAGTPSAQGEPGCAGSDGKRRIGGELVANCINWDNSNPALCKDDPANPYYFKNCTELPGAKRGTGVVASCFLYLIKGENFLTGPIATNEEITAQANVSRNLVAGERLTIKWGDGESDIESGPAQSPIKKTHKYMSNGNFTVSINLADPSTSSTLCSNSNQADWKKDVRVGAEEVEEKTVKIQITDIYDNQQAASQAIVGGIWNNDRCGPATDPDNVNNGPHCKIYNVSGGLGGTLTITAENNSSDTGQWIFDQKSTNYLCVRYISNKANRWDVKCTQIFVSQEAGTGGTPAPQGGQPTPPPKQPGEADAAACRNQGKIWCNNRCEGGKELGCGCITDTSSGRQIFSCPNMQYPGDCSGEDKKSCGGQCFDTSNCPTKQADCDSSGKAVCRNVPQQPPTQQPPSGGRQGGGGSSGGGAGTGSSGDGGRVAPGSLGLGAACTDNRECAGSNTVCIHRPEASDPNLKQCSVVSNELPLPTGLPLGAICLLDYQCGMIHDPSYCDKQQQICVLPNDIPAGSIAVGGLCNNSSQCRDVLVCLNNKCTNTRERGEPSEF